MSRVRWLIVAGVVAYLLFLAAALPARLAFGWFAPQGVRAQGVTGTIWSGSASAIAADDLVLGRTSWSMQPLKLLAGRLSVSFETRYGSGSLQGVVSAGLGSRLRLRNLRGVLPVEALSVVANVEMFDGTIGIDMQRAVLNRGWPVAASGTIDIADLKLTAPVTEALGSYEISFAGGKGGDVEGVFADIAGPIDAGGTLTLRPDRSWQLAGAAAPGSDASAQLSTALGMLGPLNANGQHEFSLSGEF